MAINFEHHLHCTDVFRHCAAEIEAAVARQSKLAAHARATMSPKLCSCRTYRTSQAQGNLSRRKGGTQDERGSKGKSRALEFVCSPRASILSSFCEFFVELWGGALDPLGTSLEMDVLFEACPGKIDGHQF